MDEDLTIPCTSGSILHFILLQLAWETKMSLPSDALKQNITSLFVPICLLSVKSVVQAFLTNDRNTFVWTLCSPNSATEKNQKLSLHCKYLTPKEFCNFGFLWCNSFERSGFQPKDSPAQRITFLLWQSLTVVIPDNKFREYQEWEILKKMHWFPQTCLCLVRWCCILVTVDSYSEGKNKQTSSLGKTENTLLQ